MRPSEACWDLFQARFVDSKLNAVISGIDNPTQPHCGRGFPARLTQIEMELDRLLQDYLTPLSEVKPAQWCQAFFLLAAGGVAAVAAMPRHAKALLVDYGARKSPKQQADRSPAKSPSRGRLLCLLDIITSYGQVPHSWFGAFYVVSLAFSIFWLAQYFRGGAVLQMVASSQASARAPSATLAQVALGWLMMFLQAARRVWEHVTIIKPSKSTMWVVHWLLGLSFYLVISVSIWIEGSGMVPSQRGVAGPAADCCTGAILDPEASQAGDAESILKSAVAVPVFLLAWANQYRCHAHLAGLKKYSLPEGGMFRHYICPHYTCECLIYLSMAVATAPRGSWCNRTLLCALVFVVANLGVTASGTRKWYADKFGVGAVANKWNMIPVFF